MTPISLNAQFDGERILLDEPFELPANARLIVTVVPPEVEAERTEWTRAAAMALARAYGDDEPLYAAQK